MIITDIELRDWRSYETANLSFDKGLNLIRGANGSGKTNLAEAIYFLSLARSWRVDDEEALIRSGAATATVIAHVKEGELQRSFEIRVSRDGKKIFVNGKAIRRLSELSKLVNVIMFSPSDTSLFVGSPGERRSFLDVNLSKTSLDYFSLIGRFNHLLSERNAILKGDHVDKVHLGVVTDEMIKTEEPISRYRRLYIAELNKRLSPIADSLYGSARPLQLVYKPFGKWVDNFIEKAKEAYERALESDLIHKNTSIGIHREDFSLLLDGRDIGVYGSQGENRLAAIALKISPYFLIEDEGKKPIAVLDDVYSELDEEHSERLTELIKSLSQTFVTAADKDISGASIIEVADHKAKRRN